MEALLNGTREERGPKGRVPGGKGTAIAHRKGLKGWRGKNQEKKKGLCNLLGKKEKGENKKGLDRAQKIFQK